MTFPGMPRCSSCGMPLDGSVENWTAPPKSDGLKVISQVNQDAPYLPYEPREVQLDIIRDIRNALDAGKHIVIESGTGTGKTITSLAGSLEHAKARGKKIIYITRTISQSDQVMKAPVPCGLRQSVPQRPFDLVLRQEAEESAGP